MADVAIARIGGIENQSIVDGPGIRMAIFFQGCAHNCKGCHNPQLFDYSLGEEYTLQKLLDKIDEAYWIDGITLTGGEPFDQPEFLKELTRSIDKTKHNIIAFSGYTYEYLNEKYPEILKYCDILIDGKFVEEKRSLDLKFRGSLNQRIIDLNESRKLNKLVETEFA